MLLEFEKMGYIVKVLTNTFKETTVGTLNYSLNATNLIEKLCWFLMWIFGSILTFMIISDQLDSWKRNPTISTRKWVNLSRDYSNLIESYIFLFLQNFKQITVS